MPEIISTIVIIALLAVSIFFAVRKIVKNRKKGGCCGCGEVNCKNRKS